MPITQSSFQAKSLNATYLFQVTEDLKVITEEDEAAPEDGGAGAPTQAPESPLPSRTPLTPRPPLRRTPSLSKRESLMSINRQACHI